MSDAAALQHALCDVGLPCLVEARERLAVIMPDATVRVAFAEGEHRQRALRLAAACGFTHLAVELPAAADAPDAAGMPAASAALPRA